MQNTSAAESLNCKLTKYMESRSFKFVPELSSTTTIWIKPLINAPFGFGLWVGSMIRNIQIVSMLDYLTSQRKFVTKSYNMDFLPLKAGKS